MVSRDPLTATLQGLAANLTEVAGSASFVQTQNPINSQVSTIRSSTSAIGLDIASAERSSQLESAGALGLNVSSPSSPSELDSSAAIGLDVSSAQSPSTLSATADFAGSPDDRFDSGTAVQAGSFTVNGVSISVGASDTINDVLNRISASGASVTASISNNRISLAINGNSEDDIAVGNDTSGFLAATHLADAITARGNVRDDQQVLYKTSQFGGVSSGGFRINGQSITVDAGADTLASILGKINASSAGVTASYDASSDKIKIVSNQNSNQAISIGDDTSGFLAATHLDDATSTVGGAVPDDQQVLSQTTQFGGVSSGGFRINGQSITIDASTDTLQSVIGKINGAGAGVTASYDSSSDKIVLTSNGNSEDLIGVGDDTSGFLAAAQLSSENTVRGNIRDDQQLLYQTSQFGSVASGSFDVNGTTISIDPGADTLSSVLAKINASGAGVTAAYDSTSDRITIAPNTAGATLSLANDSTGFFDAAHLQAGAVGTHVNADAAFNATALAAPLFDSGQSVQAGSFSVNGVSINVDAADNIRSVLAKITASSAGVTASYDDSAQTIRLTSNTASATPVTLSDDTSGFLAAVKLDGTAQSTAGSDAVNAFDAALRLMPEYGGVGVGIITVNGQSISVNPDTVSLRGLVNELNSLTYAGATLNESTGQIKLAARYAGGSLALSDTSGLLSALGISTGTFNGSPGSTQAVEVDTGKVALIDPAAAAANVTAAIGTLNKALTTLSSVSQTTPQFTGAVDSAIAGALGSVSGAAAKGLSITGQGAGLRIAVDQQKLTSALTADPNALKVLFGGTSDLSRALTTTLQTFSDSAATYAAAPAQPSPPVGQPPFVLGSKTQSDVLGDQNASALIEVGSATRGLSAASSSAQRAQKAYAQTQTRPLFSADEKAKKLFASDDNKKDPFDSISAAKAKKAYGASKTDIPGTSGGTGAGIGTGAGTFGTFDKSSASASFGSTAVGTFGVAGVKASGASVAMAVGTALNAYASAAPVSAQLNQIS